MCIVFGYCITWLLDAINTHSQFLVTNLLALNDNKGLILECKLQGQVSLGGCKEVVDSWDERWGGGQLQRLIELGWTHSYESWSFIPFGLKTD